jgi:CheY-like chemotaxis protein
MLSEYRAGLLEEKELAVSHRYGMLKCGSFDEFFHEIAYSPDIIQLSSSITIPLLLFRGEYDEVMDVRKTNELYEKLNTRVPSKLFITDSKNHFHNDRWDLIQETTLNFFDEYCSFKASAAPEKTKNVLVIDDDVLITKTLSKALETIRTVQVAVANSGEEALERIRKNCSDKKSFDLIIADIRMPGLDGIETIQRMKQIMGEAVGKESPVIFITGYEGGRSQAEAKALGYVDYLHKPLDLEIFRRCVVKQLGL